MDEDELYGHAKTLQVSHELLKKTAELGRLPGNVTCYATWS